MEIPLIDFMDPHIDFMKPYRFPLKISSEGSLDAISGDWASREPFHFSLGNMTMKERIVWFKILLIDYMAPLVNFMDTHII